MAKKIYTSVTRERILYKRSEYIFKTLQLRCKLILVGVHGYCIFTQLSYS